MNSHEGATALTAYAETVMTVSHGEMVTNVSSSYWSHPTSCWKGSLLPSTDGKVGGTLGGNNDVTRIKRENDRLKLQKTCRVCFSAEVEVLLLPCRHLVCCEKCEPAVNNCPLPTCKKRILAHARVYLT